MNIAHAAICAALLIGAAPGHAHDSSTVVRISDLDRRNPRDAAILERRLAAAIERVCGSYASVDGIAMDEVTQCRRNAKAGIARQMASQPARTSEVAGH